MAPYWSIVQLARAPVPPPPSNEMAGGVAYPRPPLTITTPPMESFGSYFVTNPETSRIAPDPIAPGLPLGYCARDAAGPKGGHARDLRALM